MSKADIIAKLRQDLLSLQGLRPASDPLNVGLGPIESAFPNDTFPTGAMHEFLSDTAEDAAATYGFIAAILAPLMQLGGACVWIRKTNKIFPPALTAFGIRPDQVIFIDQSNDRPTLWAAEEALKCPGLAAVILEIQDISLIASRRLQLAVEQSRVTGFIIRYKPRSLHTIASVAQWRIQAYASVSRNGMPGLGFPRWQVELLRVRNGKPGKWLTEYMDGRLLPVVSEAAQVIREQNVRRKIG